MNYWNLLIVLRIMRNMAIFDKTYLINVYTTFQKNIYLVYFVV